MGLLFYLVAYWILSAAFHEWVSPRRWRRKRQLKMLAHQLNDRLKWERDRLSDDEIEWRQARLDEARELRKEVHLEEEVDVLLMRTHLPELIKHFELNSTWAGDNLPPASRKFYQQALQQARDLQLKGSPEEVKRFSLDVAVREAFLQEPSPSSSSSRPELLARLLAPASQAESHVMRAWTNLESAQTDWQAWLSLDHYRRLLAGSSPKARLRATAEHAKYLLASDAMAFDDTTRQRLQTALDQATSTASADVEVALGRLTIACQLASLHSAVFWHGELLGSDAVELAGKIEKLGASLVDDAAGADRLAGWFLQAPHLFAAMLYRQRLHRWSASLSTRDAKWLEKLVTGVGKVALTQAQPDDAIEKVYAQAKDEAGTESKSAASAKPAAGGPPEWLPMVSAAIVLVVVSRAFGSRLGLLGAAIVFGLSWAHAANKRGQLMPKVMRIMKQGVPEFVELIVVVFGVVAGLRGLFVQPFKIPTGSMQPTLFGIHYEQMDEPPTHNIVKQAFDYVNYSYRYADAVIKKSGQIEAIRQVNPFLLFPTTKVTIAGDTYSLPGDKQHAFDIEGGYFRGYSNPPNFRDGTYQEGDILARGRLLMGDHLFVDRVSYNFVEPKRGDVAVFITDGIKLPDGRPLGGRYYIKRMVGLPGDTLRITQHHLYIKPRGDTEFRPAEYFNPAFKKLYTFKGGYRGHSHARIGSAQYLTHDEDTFTLKDNQYFMLGDNTENSQDSRYWGTVPRDHLVGRACFVWWPFSRRWGLVDKTPPENFDSPPTQP